MNDQNAIFRRKLTILRYAGYISITLGILLIVITVMPVLGIGGLFFFASLTREELPEPDPACLAEGIIRARIGDASFRLPGNLRHFGLSGGDPIISNLEDYCRYANGAFVTGTGFYFDADFPNVQADLGISWAPPVQISVFGETSSVQDQYRSTYDWFRRSIPADNVHNYRTENYDEFIGYALRTEYISVFFAKRYLSPFGNPLTLRCSGIDHVTPRGHHLGFRCSTRYEWTDLTSLSYRFRNGPYPMDQWIALDQSVQELIQSFIDLDEA